MTCSGGQLASWFGAGKLRFLTDGQGKLGESDISHSTCHLSIHTNEAFGNTYVGTCLALLQAHTAAKVSGSEFCNIQLACHLIPPWFRSLTLSESQDVSGSSWESVDRNASHYKVGFTWVHNLTSKSGQTDYLSWSVRYVQVEGLAQCTL